MDEKKGERLRGAVDFSFGIEPIIELITLPIARAAYNSYARVAICCRRSDDDRIRFETGGWPDPRSRFAIKKSLSAMAWPAAS